MRGRSKNSPDKKSTFFLNINSMVDMFTILLVFLLMNYSTAEVQYQPIEGLLLPSSDSLQNPSKAHNIYLTTSDLKINEEIVARIQDLKFSKTDIDTKDPLFLPQFFQELEKLNQAETAINKEGEILLQADARLPYETLQKVFYTASLAGYPKLKLVTLIGN